MKKNNTITYKIKRFFTIIFKTLINYLRIINGRRYEGWFEEEKEQNPKTIDYKWFIDIVSIDHWNENPLILNELLKSSSNSSLDGVIRIRLKDNTIFATTIARLLYVTSWSYNFRRGKKLSNYLKMSADERMFWLHLHVYSKDKIFYVLQDEYKYIASEGYHIEQSNNKGFYVATLKS